MAMIGRPGSTTGKQEATEPVLWKFCDSSLGMKKALLVLTVTCTAAFSFSVAKSESAQAKTSPAWPFGSGCSVKEVGKTKSSNSQVCVKSGNSYKWVKVLSKNDVYNLSPFCSQVIKSESSGAVCGWNERLGLELVRRYRPKDICIEAIRQIVYLESQFYVTGRYVDVGAVTAATNKILADTGCWK